MKVKLRTWVVIAMSLASLLVLPVRADLPTDLERWLDSVATPRLMNMVSKHPRFRGQSVGVVRLEDGKPVALDSGLDHALQEHFITALLDTADVRVPVSRHEEADILLGFEVERKTRGRSRVSVAFLDVEEEIWINRSYQSWTGVLPRDGALPARDFAPSDGSLLSLISPADHDKCDRRERHCIDVSYQLFETAYVFEFYTRDDKVVPLSCRKERRIRGETSYGLKVPRGESLNRPSLGFYVLATRDAGVARRLQHHLQSGANCSGGVPVSSLDWRREVAALVERPDVSWQAVHFVNVDGEVHQL